jgi:hypothetical protein
MGLEGLGLKSNAMFQNWTSPAKSEFFDGLSAQLA